MNNRSVKEGLLAPILDYPVEYISPQFLAIELRFRAYISDCYSKSTCGSNSREIYIKQLRARTGVGKHHPWNLRQTFEISFRCIILVQEQRFVATKGSLRMHHLKGSAKEARHTRGVLISAAFEEEKRKDVLAASR